MPLGEKFGWKGNPIYDAFSQNRQAISNAFGGLVGAKNFGDGAKAVSQGMAYGNSIDLEEMARQKQIEEANKQRAAAAASLRSYGSEPWAAAVEQGLVDPSQAMTGFLQGMGGPEPTANMRDFKFAQDNPEYANFLNPGEQPNPPSLTSIYDDNGREQKGYMTVGADGQPQFVPVGDPKANTERAEFNVSQGNAAGFADRMIAADSIISQPAVGAAQLDAGNYALEKFPWGTGNFLTSPEWQQADQAQRNFINAILRRESGAVIAESEFANARKQYFPQPGDSQAVLDQKAANRKDAISGVARSAGPAYEMPGAPSLGTPDAPAGGNVTSTGVPWSM